MSKKKRNVKKQKEKVVYYDDGSALADMSYVNRKGEKREHVQKSRADMNTIRHTSTFGDKWRTYFSTVKTMILPMFIVLGAMGVLYLLLLLLTGRLF